MEEPLAHPWPARLLLSEAEGSGVCGWLLLARVL